MRRNTFLGAGPVRGTDAAGRTGDGLRRVERASNQAGKAVDKFGMGAHGRNPDVVGHARFPGDLRVFDVELDQCLGVFRNEGGRYDDEAYALLASPADLVFGGGTDPLERSDPALVADSVIVRRILPTLENRLDGALDLPLIGITAVDDPL